jgi:hypothetical protein
MLGALLGNIVFALGGGARRTIARNPVSPTLPAQLTVARGQTVAGIRGGLSGLSGSETDYADGQRTPDVLVQDLAAYALSPAWFRSNLRRSPAIEAFYRGPVDLRRARWGGSTRGVPRLVSSTLLQPTSRTPRPEVLQAARNQAHPELARLTDVFEED